ncbi:MAG: DUF1552 domain-containing protein [Opitutaceae bacterium]|nr:DUF1552 domain-containing protein [Opitutaceae bacterium]
MTSQSRFINRRHFLRAAGITIALPLFESLNGRVFAANAAVGTQAGAAIGAKRPRRLVAVGNMLGFYQPAFFPTRTGRDYDLPTLLQPIAPVRDELTVFSGLDHGVKGGHFAIHSFLSGVRSIDAKGMPEGNITLDQRAAETVGGATRFSALTIGSEDGLHGGCMMSWTRSGTRVPPIPGPRELFRTLFVSESADEISRSADRFSLHGSILDAVNGDAKSLGRQLGARDREKLDEYLTSVRDVERQLELTRQWSKIPKPKPAIAEPQNTEFVSDLPVFYDLIALALQTDSTRIATLEIAGGFEASAFGIRKGYHALSHHGQEPDAIESLVKIEKYQMEQFTRFIQKLASIRDGDARLLDHTSVLFGSGMGNANAHTNHNLPIVLAGGGWRHGEHRAFPTTGTTGRMPLCNLYLSLLRDFGVDASRFGTSTGTLRGLEKA